MKQANLTPSDATGTAEPPAGDNARKPQPSPLRGLLLSVILCVIFFRGVYAAFITSIEWGLGAVAGTLIAVFIYCAATARR